MADNNRQETAGLRGHELALSNRQRALITGVKEVESFDEDQVALMTEEGRMLLTGQGLHVESLSLDQGRMTVAGKVDGVAYQSAKPGPQGRRLWSRLTK